MVNKSVADAAAFTPGLDPSSKALQQHAAKLTCNRSQSSTAQLAVLEDQGSTCWKIFQMQVKGYRDLAKKMWFYLLSDQHADDSFSRVLRTSQ